MYHDFNSSFNSTSAINGGVLIAQDCIINFSHTSFNNSFAFAGGVAKFID